MNNDLQERFELVTGRIAQIPAEELAPEGYRAYFSGLAALLTRTAEIYKEPLFGEGQGAADPAETNRALYRDILPESYETCYGNPDYAASCFGPELGRLLAMLYAEVRHCIPYAYEKRLWDLTVLYELFSQVYSCFGEGEVPKAEEIRDILYWFFSDYCQEMLDTRIRQQVDASEDFALRIIMDSDLSEPSYLYRYGEYITENEIESARLLGELPEEEIEALAKIYTEGYKRGFEHAGIDLSKKLTVNIRYPIGFERMIRAAVKQFAAMGLKPTIFRYGLHAVNRRQTARIGYTATSPNPQYDYDHRMDDALFLDEDFVSRKLRCLQNAYRKVEAQAKGHAGPAVVETFGEELFVPLAKPTAFAYTPKQQKLSVQLSSKAGQITNRYIPGDERSFTIIAFPVAQIGEQYRELFRETVKVNTLDNDHYQQMQQLLIDAMDQGVTAHIRGKDGNLTDLTIGLYPLQDPAKQTIFENCVADVNIPVGEIFTSPVLSGTHGLLHVKQVYLEGLLYKDLKLYFTDGFVTDYSCANFDDEEENRAYIRENILHNHDTLPMGEFAIGTNTTAYRMARTYGIEAKLPILIAEKTGTHFAVGDTCYSWMEEVPVFNPDGKEIVARDNAVSLLRKTDAQKAYMNCHLDVTLPYEELGRIYVTTADGRQVDIYGEGGFVLAGCETLNIPLNE